MWDNFSYGSSSSTSVDERKPSVSRSSSVGEGEASDVYKTKDETQQIGVIELLSRSPEVENKVNRISNEGSETVKIERVKNEEDDRSLVDAIELYDIHSSLVADWINVTDILESKIVIEENTPVSLCEDLRLVDKVEGDNNSFVSGAHDIENDEYVLRYREQYDVQNDKNSESIEDHVLHGTETKIEEIDISKDVVEDEEYGGFQDGVWIPMPKRPRRVTFDPNIRRNPTERSDVNFVRFNGMGTHEIVQRMADRGQILYISGELKWVGGPISGRRNCMERIGEEEEEEEDIDMSVGGTVDLYDPMTVSNANTPKWRFRKKKSEKLALMEQYRNNLYQVDPSSIIPVTVSGSLGSTGSGSETDLGTDEDEDESELPSQAWVVTKEEPQTPSPAPVQQPDYELIEEPEYILSSEPIVEGPPMKKRKQKHEPQPHTDGKIYPKPGFSYSCLIAMSLKNSKVGSLPVSEIYKFMCDHFPYFKTAPSGWKNSVRHNLSLNKCFEKIEKPGNTTRKGCLWALNPSKIHKMDEEVQKWLKKDPNAVIRAMSDPENLELIERGELKRDYSGNGGASDEDEEEEFTDPLTPVRIVTPAGRNARQTSFDTSIVGGETIIRTTPVTMSQIRATLQQQHLRVIEQKPKGQDQDQTIDLSQLGNVQGNYLCHPNGTFTLSFTGLNNQSTTPIIIRRTPVK